MAVWKLIFGVPESRGTLSSFEAVRSRNRKAALTSVGPVFESWRHEKSPNEESPNEKSPTGGTLLKSS